MKNIKDIIISKGKKAKQGPVVTRNITIQDLINCFTPDKGWEYSYLGYAYYHVNSDGTIYDEEQLIKEFLQKVDKIVKPWWCPRFILRLLDLFGNDNSIVRVRNRFLHNLFNKITKGIIITDMKWKWSSYRIYGYFTDEIELIAQETISKIELLEKGGQVAPE